MTDEEKNIFGNQLRERRNELNLTTQKVALDAEVGESPSFRYTGQNCKMFENRLKLCGAAGTFM